LARDPTDLVSALDITASMRFTEFKDVCMRATNDAHFGERRTDLPVLVLHNVDPKWNKPERTEAHDAATKLEKALRDEGHPVTAVAVKSRDLEPLLLPHDPDEFVVFNWCAVGRRDHGRFAVTGGH
jgi:hypothetical protein